MNIFLTIVFASLLSTAFSLLVSSWISFKLMTRMIRWMVGLSIGILLGIALLHSMPEAFELAPTETNTLFALFLAGLLVFFILEKTSLLRHDHHHEGDGHDHDHGHDRQNAGHGGMAVLVGDGTHNFIDGVLIATAFVADTHLGFITTLAIVGHEVPQKIGNFIVLLNAQFSRLRAYLYMLFSGVMALLGAVFGYLFLNTLNQALPYMLVISASGFVYIALSDLMPQSHKHKQTLPQVAGQIALILLGLIIIVVATSLGESHAH